MNFKTKIEGLGNTFNLHSNSTNAQSVDAQLVTKEELESDLHSHTPFHNDISLIKLCTFFPLYLINYLIGLAFWAFPIGLKCAAWSGTKRDQ